MLLCITNNSIKHHSFVYAQLNDQTHLFLTIQSSISHLFALTLNVKQFYLTLSCAITPDQRGPGSDGNEEVLCIPQNPSITRASPSDCLVSYPGHSLGEDSYSFAEIQSLYSTAPADWAINSWVDSSL